MRYRSIITLSVGHMVTDINQGAVPALLPFLISAYGLTYAAAAAVVFATNMSSSLVQPLFGHLADRISKPWLMPMGLVLAGAGLALVGVVPNYRLVLCVVAVSGIGIAAFHPEGARLVNALAGARKATALSLFGVGGQFGFAIGPVLTTFVVASFGLDGTLLLAVPLPPSTVPCSRAIPRHPDLQPRPAAQTARMHGGPLAASRRPPSSGPLPSTGSTPFSLCILSTCSTSPR